MHPQRNLIQIAEAIGDELYYDSRKPSERGDPEKKKSAELDMMQKSMLMPRANEPKPIQPGDEPTTVGDLKKAAQGMKDAPNHPLIQSLGKKLGKLGDNVTGVDGSGDFYLHLDAIKNIVNKYQKSKTPQKEPVRGVLNNGVDYTTEAIKQPEPFRVKKTENGGRDYNFENGGDVSISVNDDDHHVVNINHDNMSSVGAAIAHHLSKTPGGPNSISTPDINHRPVIKNALNASGHKWTGKEGHYNIVGPRGRESNR